jgi:predicted hydrocarbon binding protein
MIKPTVKDVQKALWENCAIMTGFLTKKFIEVFGDRGREAIKDAMREAGNYKVSKDLEKTDIKERGTKALANYMTKGSSITGFEFETIELSDKKYAIRVSKCPIAQAWKEMKAPPELCDLLAIYDEGAAKAFNPKLTLKLPKHMLKGDPYCEYIFEEEK